MSEYAGSDWIKRRLPFVHPEMEMSNLGEKVADLLGELFCGIYHLDHKALYRVDWSNNSWIEFSLGWHELATVDFDELTRLVFLAHHFAIRVSISASTHKYLKIMFHQRQRGKEWSACHPTLDEAVSRFKNSMIRSEIPEYAEEFTEGE